MEEVEGTLDGEEDGSLVSITVLLLLLVDSTLTGTVMDVGEVIVVSSEVVRTFDVLTLDSVDEGVGEGLLSPGVLVGSTIVAGDDEEEGGEDEVVELSTGEELSGVEEDD